MGVQVTGRRLPDGEIGEHPFEASTYGRVEIGGEKRRWIWACVTPNGHYGNLDGHNVVEHEDGTITVSPSILVSEGDRELWHGWLEHGIWREC